MTTDPFNLSGYSSIEVEFYFRCVGMENGEDFWLQYDDGSGFTTVATWVKDNVNILNNTFYTSTVTLNSADYSFVNGGRFRFRNDASVNNDRTYIDAITITGLSTGSNSLQGGIITQQVGPTLAPETLMETEGMEVEIQLYPNPASAILHVETGDDAEFINIYSLQGKLIQRLTANGRLNEIQLSGLASGMYVLEVRTAEEVYRRKFVKE